jgi:pimeloyl-ACP methyl ester carboxylesterase
MTEVANAIKVPTLSIVGSEDKLINPLELKTLHDYLVANHQNSNFVQLEGVGHLSNIESPDEFNNTVIRFLYSIG